MEVDGPGEVPRERFKSNLPANPDEILSVLKPLAAIAPQRVWLGAFMPYRGDDRRRLQKLGRVAHAAGVPLLATNDVLYHVARAPRIAGCHHLHSRACDVGRGRPLLEVNAERYLKSPQEMAELFRDVARSHR